MSLIHTCQNYRQLLFKKNRDSDFMSDVLDKFFIQCCLLETIPEMNIVTGCPTLYDALNDCMNELVFFCAETITDNVCFFFNPTFIQAWKKLSKSTFSVNWRSPSHCVCFCDWEQTQTCLRSTKQPRTVSQSQTITVNLCFHKKYERLVKKPVSLHLLQRSVPAYHKALYAQFEMQYITRLSSWHFLSVTSG